MTTYGSRTETAAEQSARIARGHASMRNLYRNPGKWAATDLRITVVSGGTCSGR